MNTHALSPTRPILLVEDNLEDIELTMAVLGKNHMDNQVVVVRHGADAWTICTIAALFKTSPPAAPSWSSSI